MLTLSDFFDQINTAIESNRPFVVFSKPNSKSIKTYIQITEETHVINDYSESGFVFAPFDSEKKSYYIPLKNSIVLELEHQDIEGIYQSSSFREIKSISDHSNLVTKAIDEINTTNLEKVVLSKEFKFNLENSDQDKLSETTIDYGKERLYTPFSPHPFLLPPVSPPTPPGHIL